ncbi:hypothetical protein ZQ65_25665 [Salmonella enterica subsp. enterica serovar Newport]|uniref:Ead/Ea22-like family protein n=1 Tax=Salmonella newport TaxID=108619 RepID=A0A5U9KW77_SALNE|nr:hypothetical protein [Salmonella enterica subsp. enterica serovar Newport]ECN8543072.1 hypothetical protein [Salmonella enterica subsp. enterica serovar Newport]
MSNEHVNQYAERDAMQLDKDGGYYSRHIQAMTREGLHSKGDIAAELAWRDQQIEQLREKLKQAEEKNLRLLGFVDSYDWQRQRLHQAAEKVIAWNRQEAKDRYGDADKAESWACVRELRDAIKFCEQKETSND